MTGVDWNPALAAAYLADPFAEPAPPLRALLDLMRDEAPPGRLVLVQEAPHQRWRLARLGERRGAPPVIADQPAFTSLAEGARAVFRLRWETLTGRPCPH